MDLTGKIVPILCKVVYDPIQEGKHSQGDQRNSTKYTKKDSLQDSNIPPESWKQTAQDRAMWHSRITKGAAHYKANIVCETDRKYKERKANSSSPESLLLISIALLSTEFKATIGLSKHQTETHTHSVTYEPRCEKTGLRGFRPGPTQTGLYNHRR